MHFSFTCLWCSLRREYLFRYVHLISLLASPGSTPIGGKPKWFSDFFFFTRERWEMVVVVIGEVSQLACGHFLNESSDTPHWWFSPLQQDLCHYCDQNQSISQSLCLPLSASRSNAAESILTPLCENEGWVSLLRLESVSWMQCGLYLRIYICIFNSCAQSCARISVQVWKLLAHLCSLCHAHRAWFQNSIQPCTPLC